MMHLDLLGVLPKQMDIILETLRRPKVLKPTTVSPQYKHSTNDSTYHMRLNSVPPNRQHRPIPLHALPLDLLLGNATKIVGHN
jgi:hypothetical protein